MREMGKSIVKRSATHEYFDLDKCKDISLQYTFEDEMYIRALEERKLFLNDFVSSETATALVSDIMLINRIDREIPVDERKPIILFISSGGGSVPDGFGLIDVIENSVTPVYTVNNSYAYSMAFLISLAGKKRYSYKHSTFLMHDGSDFVFDSTSKVIDKLEFTKATEGVVKDYILKHTTLSEEIYDAKYRTEWYTYADEAKKYGFIDYIIGEDCEMGEVI